MSNLGDMVARIREDLNRGTDFDSRIRRAIAESIHYYRNRRLGFNIKEAKALLTSSNEYVALPTDWIEADFLRLETPEFRQPLDEVGFDWIEDTNTAPLSEGRPVKYAIHNRRLRFYPIPDQSYTLVLSYQFEFKDVSVSASDGAMNPWTDEAEELTRKHAMSELYVIYIDGPDALAKGQLLRAECLEQIAPEMESQAAREQSSGRIRAFL